MTAGSGGSYSDYQQLGLPDRTDDRSAMIEWARAMVCDPDVVYLDTETTGFPPAAEVVDIAIVDNTGHVLLDTLVKPEGEIPSSSSRIHGIYPRDVISAPRWSDLLDDVFELIVERTVVIYNADFDWAMLRAVTVAAGFRLPVDVRWECAMKVYGSFAGQPSGYRPGEYRWFKLDEAARACGVAEGGHRALGDAEACRQVVRCMANTRY